MISLSKSGVACGCCGSLPSPPFSPLTHTFPRSMKHGVTTTTRREEKGIIRYTDRFIIARASGHTHTASRQQQQLYVRQLASQPWVCTVSVCTFVITVDQSSYPNTYSQYCSGSSYTQLVVRQANRRRKNVWHIMRTGARGVQLTLAAAADTVLQSYRS